MWKKSLLSRSSRRKIRQRNVTACKCTSFVLDLSSENDSNNSINMSWCIFPFFYSSLVFWINIYIIIGSRGHGQDWVSQLLWKHIQREISFFKINRINPESQRNSYVNFLLFPSLKLKLYLDKLWEKQIVGRESYVLRLCMYSDYVCTRIHQLLMPNKMALQFYHSVCQT